MNADNSRDSSRETGPRRVIGRPFLPGQSGNPGGRKKGLMPLVRKATSDGKLLVDFLVRVVAGKVSKATVADRIRAAAELMDRGYGKPRPTTDEAMQGAYGVLLLPSPVTAQEWSTVAQVQQQKLIQQFEEEDRT